MDTFWLEAAKQVPALTVLVIVVIIFLKYMADRDKANADIRVRETEALAKISESTKEFQKQLTTENLTIMNRLGAIIDKNTLQMGRNVYAFEQLIAQQKIKDLPARPSEAS